MTSRGETSSASDEINLTDAPSAVRGPGGQQADRHAPCRRAPCRFTRQSILYFFTT